MKQLSLDLGEVKDTKKVLIRERECLFLPAKSLEPNLVKALDKQYSFYFFEEKACAQCEFAWMRKQNGGILPECETCAAFISGMKLTKKVKIGEHFYYTVPYGDKSGLEKLLKKFKIEPQFKPLYEDHPIKPIKCTAKLYDYQQQAIDAALKEKHGVICAPPRSGKTVIATALICKIQQKTLILASQREWLNGFLETFIGSKTQQGFTDIDKSRIGWLKKEEDADKYDICLVTPQTLYSSTGVTLLKKIYKKFSVLVIDEVHFMPANRFSEVVSKLSCQYKFGLSGTPDRKDGKYVLADNLVGPVIIDLNVKRLVPQVRVVKTQFSKVTRQGMPWAYIVGPLEKDKKRQQLIAKYALQDMEAGHVILIPYTTVKAILQQVDIINKMAGKEVAKAFYGSIKKEERDKIIQDARERKLKIIVGNIKLLSTGINIPSASCLAETTISSNLPSCQQRFSRILTPCEDKPQPLIRYFLDDMDVRRACMRNEFYNVLMPIFKPVIADKDMIAIKSWLNAKSNQFKVTMNSEVF